MEALARGVVQKGGKDGRSAKDCAVGVKVRSQKKVKLVSSVVGDRVTIGLASRVIKCVVMSDVTIGDNCTVQNSIICAGAVIEKGECSFMYRYIHFTRILLTV